MRSVLILLFILSIAFSDEKVELQINPPPPVPKNSGSITIKDNSEEIKEDDKNLQRDKSRPKNLHPGNDKTDPTLPNRVPVVEFSFSS